MSVSPLRRAGGPAALALLAACRGPQHALDPAGPRAAAEAAMFWVMTGLGTAVFLAVMAALAYAVFHRKREPDALSPATRDPARERGAARWVVIALGASTVVLVGLLVADLLTGRAMGQRPEGRTLNVAITARQWWWEVVYEDPQASRILRTANEIHIPVGRPVLVKLRAADVIHSFWVPNLSGKRDLVPGYANTTWLRADKPGVYRGQCAEFCGLQHAKMALLVVAEPPDRFAAWYARQLQDSPPPPDTLAARGQRVFMSRQCAMCHTIRGTGAGAAVAPDLTHLASRRTLAAGTLPNTRGHLAGWVTDPQRVKPGTQMPASALPPADLRALLAYLESLK